MSDHALEAVIADARRRARRRRRRKTVIILGATGCVAALLLSHAMRSGQQLSDAGTSSRQPVKQAQPAVPAKRNGPITILAVPPKPERGWYAVSRIGTFGALVPFIRCPRDVWWCGEIESIAWAPRGDVLALSVTSFGRPNPYNGLHVINLHTNSDRMITSHGSDWFDLSWSPDSKTIAYAASGNIGLINADGSGARWLPSTSPGRKSSPTWSPDGRTIAFADQVNGVSSIYRIDLPFGQHLRRLVTRASAPAWSRRGVIAYQTDCGIKLMKGDGTAIAPAPARSCGAIGPPHLEAPVWSPDATKIAATYSRRTAGQAQGTYVMKADGTAVSRLTPATVSVSIGERPRAAWQPMH